MIKSIYENINSAWESKDGFVWGGAKWHPLHMEPTLDLVYTLSDDETYYIVGACTSLDKIELISNTSASAHGVVEGNAILDLSTWESKDIVIPSTYNGLPVLGIAPLAFKGVKFTSIYIADCVTHLGSFAFHGTSSTSSIEDISTNFIHLPKNLEFVGPNLFRDRMALSLIEYTGFNALRGSCNSMFCGCNSLEELPKLNTKLIKDFAQFYWATTVGQYAEAYKTKLKTIPEMDMSSAKILTQFITNAKVLVNVGGFVNLGLAYSVYSQVQYAEYTLHMIDTKTLSRESYLNIVTKAADLTFYGPKQQRFYIGNNQFLTSDIKLMAKDKGWVFA